MKCWHCNAELIWNDDYYFEDESDEHELLTTFSCSNSHCNSWVEIYLPKEKKTDEK